MTDPTRNADAFPVQDTNVSLVLGNALTREYPLVLKRIETTTALLAALQRYELWMLNVAAVAGFDLGTLTPSAAQPSSELLGIDPATPGGDFDPMEGPPAPSRYAVLPNGERVPIITAAGD